VLNPVAPVIHVLTPVTDVVGPVVGGLDPVIDAVAPVLPPGVVAPPADEDVPPGTPGGGGVPAPDEDEGGVVAPANPANPANPEPRGEPGSEAAAPLDRLAVPVAASTPGGGDGPGGSVLDGSPIIQTRGAARSAPRTQGRERSTGPAPAGTAIKTFRPAATFPAAGPTLDLHPLAPATADTPIRPSRARGAASTPELIVTAPAGGGGAAASGAASGGVSAIAVAAVLAAAAMLFSLLLLAPVRWRPVLFVSLIERPG
jgi:hypothetical protein